MAQFKVRQLTYSGTAAGSRTYCVGVFLFNEVGDPIDVLSAQDVARLRRDCPEADLVYLNAVLDELRGLSGEPEAIAEFLATRLAEASLALVLADTIAIDEPDCDAARRRASTYLALRASTANRGAGP